MTSAQMLPRSVPGTGMNGEKAKDRALGAMVFLTQAGQAEYAAQQRALAPAQQHRADDDGHVQDCRLDERQVDEPQGGEGQQQNNGAEHGADGQRIGAGFSIVHSTSCCRSQRPGMRRVVKILPAPPAGLACCRNLGAAARMQTRVCLILLKTSPKYKGYPTHFCNFFQRRYNRRQKLAILRMFTVCLWTIGAIFVIIRATKKRK